MKRIVDDVSAYYLLGYYSTNTKFDGRYRSIEREREAAGLSYAGQARLLRADRIRGEHVGPKSGPPPGAATAASDSGAEAAFGLLARLKTSTALYTLGLAADGEVATSRRARVDAAASTDRWSSGRRRRS